MIVSILHSVGSIRHFVLYLEYEDLDDDRLENDDPERDEYDELKEDQACSRNRKTQRLMRSVS